MKPRIAALSFALLFFPVAGSAQSVDATTQEADNRREFASGVAAMFAGRYDEAAQTFRKLAEHTDAPRVKLELARSLFLAKHYREAKRVFNDVYYSTGLPYEVRRSINVYLEKIDRKIGYLVPTIGVNLDTNPTRATSATDFQLLGLPVVLRQNAHGRAVGIQYGLAGRVPLDASSAFSLVSAVSGVKYSQSQNSFMNANIGLSHDDVAGKNSLETGVQYSRREKSDTLVSPYISDTYRLNSTGQSQTDFTAALSYSTFKSNSYLNGPVFQAGVTHGTEVSKETSLITGAHASITRTKDSRYDQVEVGVSGTLYRSLKAIAVDVVLSGNIGRRNFSGMDPLFGAIRRDTDLDCGIRLVRTKPLRRLFPSVGVKYERRISTLRYYSYAATGLTAELYYRF